MSEIATRESVVAELMAESAPQPETPVIEDAPVEAAPEGDEPNPDGDQPLDDPGAETPAEDEGEGDEPATAVEAPHFWSADAKARFADLAPDLQLIVLEQDKQAQRTVSQKLEEAATVRKAADAEKKVLSELNARIAEVAEQASGAFQDRWAGMTPEVWLKLAHDDVNRYTQLTAQFNAEQTVIQRANAARDDAERVNREQWRSEQFESLKTLSPELTDPVKGAALLQSVGEYLVKQGAAEQDLPNVGALEITIARKAMLFDELQALKPIPKPASKPGLRSSAPPPATPTKERQLQAAQNRFAQTSSREDLVALMLLEN